MFCPKCRYKDTKVTDSRVSTDGTAIRRRRECVKERCRFRFSTFEEVAILDLTVVKRDGRREPYSREKVLAGVRKAFERRPITTDELRQLVTRIERDIQLLRKNEVRSTEIGEIVLMHLKHHDEIAYVRFASVYQSFNDLESFRRVLDTFARKERKLTKRGTRASKKR